MFFRLHRSSGAGVLLSIPGKRRIKWSQRFYFQRNVIGQFADETGTVHRCMPWSKLLIRRAAGDQCSCYVTKILELKNTCCFCLFTSERGRMLVQQYFRQVWRRSSRTQLHDNVSWNAGKQHPLWWNQPQLRLRS